MVEIKRKTRGIEFLRELEEFVREREFPRRVIDSVTELREELETEETAAGVEERLLQIPELLNHIGRRYQTSAPQEPALYEEKIQLEDVRERVKEILELFHDSNGPLVEQHRGGQSLAKSELETDIREILHTNAHVESLRNGGSFCNFMAGAEQKYHSKTGQLLQSCTEDLFQNCDQAAAKIKSLFGHLKDEKLRSSQRRMYQQYDSRYDLLKQKISAKAAQISREQNRVSKWAAGCVKPLEEIKKKIDRKKYTLILVPLAVILIAILGFRFVMNVDFGRSGDPAALETVEETKTAGSAIVDRAIEMGKDQLKDQFMEQLGMENEGSKDDGNGIKPMLILIAVYVIYAVFIIYRSRRWYLEAVGGYLAPEVERFLENNEIQKDTEQKFSEIRTEMESDWGNLILELLHGGNYQEQVQANSEEQQFQALTKEWETIRRLA